MTTEEITASTKKLISIQSTAENRAALEEAVAYVESLVRERCTDTTIERFEKNGKSSFLAYRGKTRPKKFRVLLNGHVDVVPGKPEQFKPFVKDGKLYGRGALDMKATAVTLADIFCELAPSVPYELGLQIVGDEEIGGHDGTLYQIEQGVKADFVIAGEFTPAGTVCTEAKGLCTVRVHFAGKTAHSAYLWNGDNAAIKTSNFVSRLLEMYPIPTENNWATTVNVASISVPNATFNRVPDTASVSLDFRYIPGDQHFRNTQSVERFIKAFSPDCEVEMALFEPAQSIKEDDPMLKVLVTAMKEVTGRPVEFIKKPGAADTRFYSDRGTAAVVFGLQGEGLHGDNEYLELSSVETYQTILRRFLTQLT